MAYRMDFFAGIESKVIAAIESSKVKYPAFVFVRDENESTTGRLAFVDQNNILKYVRGENKQHVLYVSELPENGDVEVLYIMDGIVYVFDGENYNPMYKDNTAELEELTERVSSLEVSNADVVEKLNTVTEQMTEFEERIIEIEKETFTFIELE